MIYAPVGLLSILALTVSGFLLPLHAADEPTTWEIRVAAIDIIPGHDTLWLRTGEGTKPVQVALNLRTFSQPLRYKGPAKAVFYRNEAEAKLAEPPAPLASAALSDKASLIVFSPRPDGTGYQTMVIGDSGFPFGSFRFVNLSGVMALAEIDGKKIRLKQGAAETVIYREAKNSLPVRIMTATDDGGARLVRQSFWSIDQSQRELIFLTPGSAPGLITLHHFIDSKAE